VLETVFVAAGVLVAYTYAGYPLLLRVLVRLRGRATERGDAQPPVAIVVVAYDEADRIAAKVRTCLGQDYPADRLRMVVVSDGSTDATVERALAEGGDRVQAVAFERRRGKAACLNDVVPACPEPIVVLTDVRQRLSQDAVARLVAALGDPSVGAVGGALVLETEGGGFGQSIDAYWRYETAIRRAESALHSSVGVSGALYAIRRSLFRTIPPDTVLDDVLIPMQVASTGHRVLFEDGARAFDRPAASADGERTRKTRTLAGNFQLLAAHPWLLSPRRNPLFVQFVSHKVLRLLVPAALAAMLLASAVLAPGRPFWTVVLALQLAGYLLPLAGRLSPALARLRAVRLATAFLVLNSFVVLGLIAFLRSRETHLWQVTRVPPPSPDGQDH
jgi:biofilm PGA synthesis N-glycosyltransferase PgaC